MSRRLTTFARACAATLAVACLVGSAVRPAAAQIAPDAPQGPAPATNLRDLVGRYRAWRGGFALESLETIHERLEIDTPTGQATGAVWIERDGRTRRETATAAGRRIEVATSDGAWRAAPGGPVKDDPGGFERARRYALLAFGDALSGRGGATVAMAGSADVGGRTWTVVRVTYGDADVYEALLDPSSGWLCCYRITESGATRLEMLGDWRLVDGVRMPFAELVKSSGEVGSRVSAIELNRSFPPSLFAKPPG